jgi:hypothetical protein
VTFEVDAVVEELERERLALGVDDLPEGDALAAQSRSPVRSVTP